LPGSLRTESVDNVTHFGEQENDDVQMRIFDQFDIINPVDPIFSIPGCNF